MKFIHTSYQTKKCVLKKIKNHTPFLLAGTAIVSCVFEVTVKKFLHTEHRSKHLVLILKCKSGAINYELTAFKMSVCFVTVFKLKNKVVYGISDIAIWI